MKSTIKHVLQWALIALLPAMLPLGAVHAKSPIDGWTIMTESYPPFNFEKDGQLSGVSTEIMVELLARTKSTLTKEDIKLLPWARAYKLTLSEPNHILYSTTRTPSREDKFKWVGPFVPTVIGIIAKKENAFKIETVGDLSALRIGVVKDDIGQLLLQEAGFPKNRLEPVLLNEQNFKKLYADRVDAIAYETSVASWQFKENGKDQSDFEVIYELNRSELYLALHPDTPDNVVQLLQSKLDEMKQDGAHAAILDRYFAK